jgi:hypothetical protein
MDEAVFSGNRGTAGVRMDCPEKWSPGQALAVFAENAIYSTDSVRAKEAVDLTGGSAYGLLTR